MLPHLSTKRLNLRMPLPSEASLALNFFIENREHLTPVEPLRSDDFYTLERWQKTLVKNQEEFLADQSLRLFIFFENQVIGSVSYTNFSRGVFQACNLGYSLSKKFEGKGVMFEALSASNRFVFEELKFHRIMANYMPRNIRSGALLERLGFTKEGLAKDYIQIQGKWEDHVLTSLIR